MQQNSTKFRITDHIEFDDSGRAQCPSCLLVGKTDKNLSVMASGAYKCFRECTPTEIRAALGQEKPHSPPQPLATPNKKALTPDATITKDNRTLLQSNGPAKQWLHNRGITDEMIAHYRLGIAQCKIGPKGKEVRRWGISIPIPALSVDGKYYRKKRVCPWDTDAPKLDGYKKWSQWGLPSMVYFSHRPPSPRQTWIVEGEWDALMLGWLVKDRSDIAVATFTCGAGKIAPPDPLDLLQGRLVSFYDQNDKPTQKGTVAARTSETLLHEFFGDRYHVGVPPMTQGETKEGYDVSDAINAGFTLDDFINAAQQSKPLQKEASETPRRKQLRDLLTWNDDLVARAPDYTNWLVDGILTSNEMFLLAAGPRCGKSLFSMTLSHAVASGSPFLGRPVTQGTVFYVHCEDSEGKIKERQINQGWGEGLPIAWLERFKISESLDELRSLIREHDARLVVLDTLSRVKDATISESSAEMSQLLEPLQETAQKEDCTILLVHHIGKIQADGASETDIFDRIRGSSAIRATCRGSMILAAGEQHHRLLTENGWNKEDLKIRLNTVTTRWELVGRWNQAKNVPQKQQIVNYLKTVLDASIEQIHEATGIRKKSLYEQLARLQVSENAEDKVIKRGSKRNYTYALEHQGHIQLLNKVLKRPNVDTEEDTGYYSTKNDFSLVDNDEKVAIVPDTTTPNLYGDSLVEKVGTLCPEGDTAENGPNFERPQIHKVLNKGGKQGSKALTEGDSAYSTTIPQKQFVEYRRSFRDDPKNSTVCQSRTKQGHFGEDLGHLGPNQGSSSTCDSDDNAKWVYHTQFDTIVKLVKRGHKESRIDIPGLGIKTVDNTMIRDEFVAIDGEFYKVVQRGNKWLQVVKGPRGRKKFAYNLETNELEEMKHNANG